MRRRDLVMLLTSSVIATRRRAQAQRARLPLIVFFNPYGSDKNVAVFRQGLREFGYIDGKNITLVVRSPAADDARLPVLAGELAALKPDVIVTHGEAAIRAVKAAAGATPIVMAVVADPIVAGLAQSLAHPGGNLTGLAFLAGEVLGKRLELLHEIVPDPGCVGVLGPAGIAHSPTGPIASRQLAAAAKALGVTLVPLPIADIDGLATAFAEMVRQRCRAALVMTDPRIAGARRQLVDVAAQHRIAASYDNSAFVDAGGLMSYGPDFADMFRHAAAYVDKILKGAKPADLPIEQPAKFKLAINLKAAKALGLTLPPLLLAGADEVIE